MTKKQMKERALLLLAYAFMKETLERSKDVPLSEITKADLTFTSVYKKLDRIKRTFANEKIRNFLLKRVPEDINKTCDLGLVAVVVLAWFKRLNLTKEIVIKENLEELTEAIVKSVDFETAKNSIEFASELVADVFPDQKGLIEFRKISGKFPFNLIKENENVSKTA